MHGARHLAKRSVGFSLSGPNSRKVMEKLTDGPLRDLPFMGCGTFDIGLIRAKVARLSVTGEMGYEINCRCGEHIALRRMLLEAGADLGMREVGFNALLSLRLEKSFGIWSAEFTQGYTAGADRHGPLDRLGQGRFHRPRRGAGRARRQRPGAGDRRRWRSTRRTPMPAATSRSGRMASGWASSPRAAMATRSANRWPWRWSTATCSRAGHRR